MRLTTSARTEAAERKLDQVLADSFPASDPPPWTLGRTDPNQIVDAVTAPLAQRNNERASFRYTTDVVIAAGSRTGVQRLTSGVGAIGVAMLVPLGILAVGLPIALAVRALIEVAGWLTALAP